MISARVSGRFEEVGPCSHRSGCHLGASTHASVPRTTRGLRQCANTATGQAPWSLGKWGMLINICAAVFSMYLGVFMVSGCRMEVLRSAPHATTCEKPMCGYSSGYDRALSSSHCRVDGILIVFSAGIPELLAHHSRQHERESAVSVAFLLTLRHANVENVVRASYQFICLGLCRDYVVRVGSEEVEWIEYGGHRAGHCGWRTNYERLEARGGC